MQTGRSRQLHCERAISGCDSEEHGTSRLDASQCYWWIQTVCLSRLLIRFACLVGWFLFLGWREGEEEILIRFTSHSKKSSK